MTSALSKEEDNGFTQLTVEALIHSVQFGDLKSVEAAIEQQKLSPDTVDRDGCSLLHWAAINNRLEIARYLISKNCNVNIVGGENGEIPLQWAVRQAQCAGMVNLLIEEGSNIHHKSLFGYDALFIAVQAGHTHIIFILLHSGANPDTTDSNQETPLIWILKNQFTDGIEFVRLLLKFNANPAYKGSGGNNCLHLLGLQGRDVDLGLALTIYGEGPAALVEAVNDDGLTPYKIAVKTRNSRFMRFLYDAFLYTRFPKSLPQMAIALSFFLTFVFPLFYGWFYGIAMDMALWFATSLLQQSSIRRGDSRFSNGWAWGVIITVTASYYYFISPYFSGHSDLYFDSNMDYFIGVLACLIVYTLYHSMYTVPHHLICEDSLERKRIVQKIVESKPIVNEKGVPIAVDFRLCSTCLTDKSLASIHCSKCNICVVQLDHHCPFVNNCVGRGNRRVFVFFTLFAGFGCILVSVLSYYVQRQYLCPDFQGWFWAFFQSQYCAFFALPIFTMISWLAGFVGFWIVCICLGQIHLIANEMTTFEIIRKSNRNRPNQTPCCSAKAARNVHQFCQTGQYLVNEYVGTVTSDCSDCGHDHHHHGHSHSHSHHSLGRSNQLGQKAALSETDQKLLAMNV